MMTRLVILSVFFFSLATATVEVGVPTRDDGGSGSGGGRRVSYSTHQRVTRLNTENWPESDAPHSACSGGLCGNRVIEEDLPGYVPENLPESSEPNNSCPGGVCSEPPLCVTGNECGCGGRTCYSVPKFKASSHEQGDPLITEHLPASDEPNAACPGGSCNKPPGCVTGNECECNGRNCITFSQSPVTTSLFLFSQSSATSSEEQGDRLVTEHLPESGEPNEACPGGFCDKPPGCVTGNECECGGRQCVSFAETSTPTTEEHVRLIAELKPNNPGCVTGNECECGGRICASIPKTPKGKAKEHGARLTAELKPLSDTPSGECANGLCGKPPGCVTGNECECHAKICTRLITEHSPESKNLSGACATGFCGKPPGCVTGNECECHAKICVNFAESSSDKPGSNEANGGCATGLCGKPPGCVTGNECECFSLKCVNFAESVEPNGGCATGLCGKPPGCVTGKECECHSRHCVTFPESSSVSTQEGGTRQITEDGKKANDACATGLCSKPPGCVTGKECECHSRHCVTFPERSSGSTQERRTRLFAEQKPESITLPESSLGETFLVLDAEKKDFDLQLQYVETYSTLKEKNWSYARIAQMFPQLICFFDALELSEAQKIAYAAQYNEYNQLRKLPKRVSFD